MIWWNVYSWLLSLHKVLPRRVIFLTLVASGAYLLYHHSLAPTPDPAPAPCPTCPPASSCPSCPPPEEEARGQGSRRPSLALDLSALPQRQVLHSHFIVVFSLPISRAATSAGMRISSTPPYPTAPPTLEGPGQGSNTPYR